ncbi:MAG: hypothetical protein WDN48_02140 [Pseudolabrys sp.]
MNYGMGLGAAMPLQTERIGIIFVHGIGEQRRFEHLETQVRPLIDALLRLKQENGTRSTIEIVGASSSPLHAEQDTWAANPDAAVRVIARDADSEKQLFFHEVWWADINEPYSLTKQIRFWCWGLSLWATPDKLRSGLSGAGAMVLPVFPGWRGWVDELLMRIRLFMVSNVFAMAALSLGALIFLAKRLLSFNAPPLVRVFVNYISAVKLYSQRRRSDGGFLDAYEEPPRVSIRRRMVRTLVDVAMAPYDRWYVFAHSLGSVVAFNGLMENAHALPNYLDEARWKKLKGCKDEHDRRLAGAARPRIDYLADYSDMRPARPLWLKPKDVIYRDRLFAKFSGLLTYGSPLDKFAAIWAARVPINKYEPAFAHAEWINVYDPTDPVAARLDAFGSATAPASDLPPNNYGFRAHWALLFSHLRYLRGRKGYDNLSDAAMRWVMGGKPFAPQTGSRRGAWIRGGSFFEAMRYLWAWVMWILAYVALAMLGALTLPLWQRLLAGAGKFYTGTVVPIWQSSFRDSWTWAYNIVGGVFDPVPAAVKLTVIAVTATCDFIGAVAMAVWGLIALLWSPIQILLTTIGERLPLFPAATLQLMLVVGVGVALVGMLGRIFVFRRDRDDPLAGEQLLARARRAVHSASNRFR